jgi:ABC-type glycerol-3-phosphate transport system substrate-binding protein
MRTSARELAVSIATIAALGVAGCGSSNRSPSTTVQVWHWMTDREDAFVELAKRYKEEHGGDVKFELYAPGDVYAQKVRAAAQTNGLPDVYSVLGEARDLASFIQAGHVLNLTEPLDINDSAWRSVFFPVALNVNGFSDQNVYGVPAGIYGVPIDIMNIQLFYNRKLLAKLGYDPEQPPTTWEQFLEVGRRAKAEGMVGFVSGWAELWMIDCFAGSYAVHMMGQDKVLATVRGDIPYNDPDWIRVFQLFQELRDSKMLAEGIVTMGNKRAEQLFANEQAVFAFNGSWGVNVYQGMNPDLDYGVIMLPVINPDQQMVTWGGAGSSFMVNARSPRAAPAVAFLQWLTDEPQQRYLLDTTHNIPANQVAAQDLPPVLAAFADDMDYVTHPRLFDVQERSTVIEGFDKGIQSILIGEKTPKQVADDVQQTKAREETRRAALAASGAAR